MASEMLGRAPCPECGFPHAHIKIKSDKDGANPYRHCPDCGAQYFTRNKAQADNLRAKLNAQAPTPPAPQPEPEAPQAKARKPSRPFMFGVAND